MPLNRSKLPVWLNNAYTESHIGLVLRTLAERESRRESIRSISRRQTSPTSSPESLPSHSSPASIPKSYLEHYSVAIANHKQNVHRNRYCDIVPYDRTRVVAESGDAVGGYLNASWVLERHGHKWWIATQAPLPTTIHTFLNLISQPISQPPKNLSTSQTEGAVAAYGTCRIRTVVQLTKNVESGRTKAHSYFPSQIGKSIIVPPDPEVRTPALKVTLLNSQNFEDAQCIQSTVAITPVDSNPRSMNTIGDESEDHYGTEETDSKRVIFQHLLYTAWPDHGVPEDADRTSLLAFLKLADKVNRDLSLCNYPPISPPVDQRQYDPDPPILVGCSAGVGRTGTFIALSSLLRHHGFLPPAVEPTPATAISSSPLGALPDALVGDLVVEEIDSLREQRPRMVERPEQALLVYELLISAFQDNSGS